MFKNKHYPALILSLQLSFFPTFFGTAFSQEGDEQETISYLKSLSIEELLQTEVTSVSKKSEALFRTAAAITVITQEDIERTGARSIPEALRMVPGLNVASVDGSRYAIGSRGFNEIFETKLLVLIDGRSMYTPLFSGVNWQSLDTVMEDIERIEVIRGPGATIWGANAVNGVINIITKNSCDTQGGLVSVTGGNIEQPNISVRYGSRINDDTTYRLYAKGYNRNNYDSLESGDAHDASQSGRTGFRLDSTPSATDTFSMQGEIFDGEADVEVISSAQYPAIKDTETYRGGHILASWEHRFSETSSTNLQLYYDRTERDQIIAADSRDIADIEFKHHWQPLKSHDIVWGAGLRWTEDSIEGTESTTFDPESRSDNLWNIFIQDDISIVKDVAWLTIGSKFEENDYSGSEVQPSIRFRIIPKAQHLLWAAVSRAVRTPSRAEHDISVNVGIYEDASGSQGVLKLFGNEQFDSETLTAYELGYRWQITDSWLLDIAAYFNDYDELRSFKTGAPYIESNSSSTLIIPQYFTNDMKGESYGIEFQTSWQATEKLKVIAAYSFLDFDLERTDPSEADREISAENFAPEHQFHLRSYYDLRKNVSLDTELYYVDDLGEGEIDSYLRFDLQIRWQATESLQFAVGGENLFNSSHQEFFTGQSNIVASEVPSQYWLKATYRF